jgi:hypothetical protein
LHGLVLRSCILSCILRGTDLCILLPPDLCSGLLHMPDLCPRILEGSDPSVLLHGLVRCLGILRGPTLCPCSFLGYPSLELLEQGFRWRLTVFRLTLAGGFGSGSDFVASRRVPCGGLVV